MPDSNTATPSQTAQDLAQNNRLGADEIDKIINETKAINQPGSFPINLDVLDYQLTVSGVTAILVKTANDTVQQTRFMSAQVQTLLSP